MPKPIHRLTDKQLQSVPAKRNRLADGGGLYLNISAAGAKSWVFIYREGRRNRELGLGSYNRGAHQVSLKRARELALEMRKLLEAGKNPLMARVDAEASALTFGDVADQYIEAMKPQWSNGKHLYQWQNTLGDAYCATLRRRPIEEVSTNDVLAVLQPVWLTKTETATRLRGRIEKILDSAKAKGLRDGENPARWRGHLDTMLPRPKKLVARGHLAAMPFADVAAFVKRLRANPNLAARALEIAIMTAGRTGEVLNAEWREFDLDAALWTVPASRMKLRKVHRVPLSPQAVEILRAIKGRRLSDRWVFPGNKEGKPLSQMAMAMLMRRMGAGDFTVHGFRSAFRDWVGEVTNFQREVAEAALAHSVGDAVERAYRRGDALAKRRKLMAAWSDYISGRQWHNM